MFETERGTINRDIEVASKTDPPEEPCRVLDALGYSGLKDTETTMSTITIAISENLREWISRKTQSGEYADSSDYVSDLIRRDQERSAKIAAMQTAVNAGLASGTGHRTADELFETARQQARTAGGG